MSAAETTRSVAGARAMAVITAEQDERVRAGIGAEPRRPLPVMIHPTRMGDAVVVQLRREAAVLGVDVIVGG